MEPYKAVTYRSPWNRIPFGDQNFFIVITALTYGTMAWRQRTVNISLVEVENCAERLRLTTGWTVLFGRSAGWRFNWKCDTASPCWLSLAPAAAPCLCFVASYIGACACYLRRWLPWYPFTASVSEWVISSPVTMKAPQWSGSVTLILWRSYHI